MRTLRPPKEATAPLGSANQSGQNQVQNSHPESPGPLCLMLTAARSLHTHPRLREPAVSFVFIGGLLHMPFAWIGQYPDLSFTRIGECLKSFCLDWPVFCSSWGWGSKRREKGSDLRVAGGSSRLQGARSLAGVGWRSRVFCPYFLSVYLLHCPPGNRVLGTGIRAEKVIFHLALKGAFNTCKNTISALSLP